LSESTRLQSMGDKQEFKRVLKLRDLVVFGIAFMTPIAPALIYGTVSKMTGGTMAMTYLIAMFAMMLTANSYGKMSTAVPVAGSTYSYTGKAFNPHLGFMSGWAIYMDYVLVPLIVLIMGGLYANALLPAVPYQVWVVLIAVAITIVTYRGASVTARTNNTLMILVSVVVLIFVIACIVSLLRGTGAGTLVSVKPFFNADTFSMSALISGAALACFSFLGFDSITTLSEEAARPEKDIARAAVLACLFGGIIFIVQAYLSQLVWPDLTTFTSEDTALFDVAQLAGGTILATLYTAAIVVCSLTAGVAGQTGAVRVMYGMGRDGALPRKFFGRLHPVYKTPTNNILIMSAISIVGALLLPISLVAELMSFGALLGFIFVNASVIAYYFVRKKERKWFSNLLVPALGTIVCFYLWINLSPTTLKVGFAWMVIGLIYVSIKTKGFKIKPTMITEQSENAEGGVTL